MTEPDSAYPGEERLRLAVRKGAKLDLGGHVDPMNCRSEWPRHQVIRAEVVAALLAGGLGGGRAALWVEGACIAGPLNHRHARLEMPLIMNRCWFKQGIDVSEAHAVSISLRNSRIPFLTGYGLQVERDLNCSGGSGAATMEASHHSGTTTSNSQTISFSAAQSPRGLRGRSCVQCGA
jgi:hypothetical protein